MKRNLIAKAAEINGRRISTATRRKVEIDHTPPEGIAPAPRLDGVKWVVAMTEPRGEAKAMQGLEEVGYPAFMPMITRWRRKGFRQHKRAYPLFPGYVFVGLVTGPKHSVKNCDSIAAVISDGLGPLFISESVVMSISDHMMAGAFDETITMEDRFAPGDLVTITEGPFAGTSAPIANLIDSERVAVLLSFLGSVRPVPIDAGMLRKTA